MNLDELKGTLRGLHYQLTGAGMGKLVRAVSGAVFDVAVDLRKGSPTFGKYVGRTLSAENGLSLWVPVGFAQPHEHLVIVGSEAGIALELAIGGREHAAAGVDPTPPGELFGLGKPANIGVFGVDVCCRAGGGCHAVQPSGFRFNVEVVPCQHTGCGQHPKNTPTTGFVTVRNLGITPILVGNMGISGKPGRPP